MDRAPLSETEIRVTNYGASLYRDTSHLNALLRLAGVATVEPVEMTIATVGTVMMLLASKEECIVLQAVRALEKFASQCRENLDALSLLGIFDKMSPLIDVTHLATRRFVYKLLVELLAIERTRVSLLHRPAVILQVFKQLDEDPDELIQEYASKILSELLVKYIVVDYLNHDTHYVEVFFQKLASNDPDIKANCLECLLHILRCPAGNEAVVTWSGFSFAPFIALLASRYERVQQLTLVILELLTRQKEDEALMEKFRDSGAVEKLIDILTKLPWHDLDRKVLCTLANIADTEKGAQMLDRMEAVDEMVGYMDSICRLENVECGFRIFMNLSKSEVGRDIAVRHHVTEIFMRYLAYDQESIVESALQGLNNMCANKEARHVIGLHEASPLVILENFLTKGTNQVEEGGPTTTWTMRSLAAATLGSLAAAERNVCQQIVHFRIQEVFYDIMWAGEAPLATLLVLVNIIEVLVMDKALRKMVAEKEMINVLLNMIQGTKKVYHPDSSQEDVEREITLSALRALCTLMAEPPVLEWFLNIYGMELLHACLKNPTTSIRETGAKLVLIMAPSETMARRFVMEGFIDTLLQQDAMRICCADWENAICLIFGYNLPAKWFYTGRLGQLDHTRDYFYTSLRAEKKFQPLESLLALQRCPIRPIYVCRFNFNEDESRHRIACNMSPGSHLQTRVSPYDYGAMSRRSRASQQSFVGQPIAPAMYEKPLTTTSLISQDVIGNKTTATVAVKGTKKERSPHPSDLSLGKNNSNRAPRERSSGHLRSKSKRAKKQQQQKRAATVGGGGGGSMTSNMAPDESGQSLALSAVLSQYGEQDRDLCHYLQHLRQQLVLTDKRLGGPTDPKDAMLTIQRVQIIAMFVAKQMVGTLPSVTCEEHIHEVHLNELKRKLSTNVIPLGNVKFGLHFERALLYKVLSDRLHNPCELVRGKHRMAWIEVYIHDTDNNNSGVGSGGGARVEEGGSAGNFLKEAVPGVPNCVLDLMDNVGVLMRLHSFQAQRYCYPDYADH